MGSSKHTNDSLSSLLHFSREAWQISYFLSFYKGRDQYQRATLVAQLIKNLPAMQETPVQFGLGRFPGEGNGYLLQYSGLENSTDCIVLGVAKSRTRLSNFTSLSPHWEDRVLSAQESPHLGWSWAFAVTGDQRRPSTWGRAARCCLRRAVIDLDPEMP